MGILSIACIMTQIKTLVCDMLWMGVVEAISNFDARLVYGSILIFLFAVKARRFFDNFLCLVSIIIDCNDCSTNFRNLLFFIMQQIIMLISYIWQSSTALVAQQAFILNASLKNNILFGSEYCKFKYQQVIEACALTSDLKVLPKGDETLIGEKVRHIFLLY